MPVFASIDFESRSRIDIKDTGVIRYAEDESTDFICMAYQIWSDPTVYLWVPGMPFPALLYQVHMFFAWNAQFEFNMWEHVGVKKHGWPELPSKFWHCTQGDAAMCGFPLKLSQAADALQVHQRKDKRGTYLINKLSKPQRNGAFLSYQEVPDLYQEMYEYCKQDVRTEKAVYDALPSHVSGEEDAIQRQTWSMNRRGLPVDLISVETIKKKIDCYIDSIDQKTRRFTNGVINSPRQKNTLLCNLEMNCYDAQSFLDYRAECKEAGEKLPRLKMGDIPGMAMDNLRGETVEAMLKSNYPSFYDRQLLKWYQDINHASVAKYKKILIQACKDGTVKDNFQYHGAGTGRDAARGLQPQNFPRKTEKYIDEALNYVWCQSPETIDMVTDFLGFCSSLIRGIIQAPHGKKLVVSDYGQVEARGTSWAVKEENILDNFRAGIDPYKAQAASMYHMDISEIGDKSTERQYGKLAVLACGYQGAHSALTKFAEDYGLSIERKEANEVVKKFRKSRPLLVQGWRAFGDTALAAVETPGIGYQVPNCQHAVFCMNGPHLTLELPNGRKLWYPYAEIQEVTVNYVDAETGEDRSFRSLAVTAMWISSYTRKWERRAISGGNLFQNYVQAICRDLVMGAGLRLEAAGYPLIARVHDEVITLVPDDRRYSIQEVDKIMCMVPEWAKGFPIDSDGYESKRYKK